MKAGILSIQRVVSVDNSFRGLGPSLEHYRYYLPAE
jgi:hypothetical protein